MRNTLQTTTHRAVNAINVEGGQNIEVENYLTIPLPGNCATTKPVAGGEMAQKVGQVAYENNPANVEAENVDLSISQRYKLICNNINIPKLPNKKAILRTLSSPPAKTNFKYHEGTMPLLGTVNFYVKDLIRQKFVSINNIWKIVYTSHNCNCRRTSLCFYTVCLYFYKKYKIVCKLQMHEFDVFSNLDNIIRNRCTKFAKSVEEA
uniref:Uncharacterized protein n=1 Tax=Glossina palpalis gambiensis TaxID=67801 RepID=A0A1B0C507_9MUSC